jgi:hypothetical protein
MCDACEHRPRRVSKRQRRIRHQKFVRFTHTAKNKKNEMEAPVLELPPDAMREGYARVPMKIEIHEVDSIQKTVSFSAFFVKCVVVAWYASRD